MHAKLSNSRLLFFLTMLAMCVGTVMGGVMPRSVNFTVNEEEHETQRETHREQSGKEHRRREAESTVVIATPLPFFLEVSSTAVRFSTAPSTDHAESSLRNGTGGPLLL